MKKSGDRSPRPCGVEGLERRVLLAAAVGHAAPVAAARYQAVLGKLDSSLASVTREYASYRSAGKPAAKFHSKIKSLPASGGSVRLEAFTKDSPKKLAASIAKLAGTNVKRFANGVSASVPIDKLTQLAQLPELWFARPIWAYTRAGNTLSQGDAAVRADIARATYGFNGSGVKVGILSDSFDTSGDGSYAADITSGDLPSGVQILEDHSIDNPTDEGRGMAQLIYDTAPGSSLAFATAYDGQQGFADNIKALRDAGANVIVDDVGYFDEPMFQDGVVAQAVDDVVSTGVSYFSAAANEGRESYQNTFNPGNSYSAGSIPTLGGDAPTFAGGISHDFDSGPGVDDSQTVTLASGDYIELSFQWDQPFGSVPGSAACANEMDIYLLDNTGTIVAGSATNNLGNDPSEIFGYQNTGGSTQNYQLMIVWNDAVGGPQPGLIKYVNYGSASITDWATNSSTSFGHNNAAGAAGVGAVPFFGAQPYNLVPLQPEPFSSVGGTPILFDTTGTPISQVIRQQPRFSAPDGGNTSFFGDDDPEWDVDTKPNFYGTSAAAPNAAAVAALMLQAKPSLTPTQVYTILQNTALDMNNPLTDTSAGFDFRSGYGLIRADEALKSIVGTNIVGQTFKDINSNGTFDAGDDNGLNGVTVYLDANNNGVKDSDAGSVISSTDVPKSIHNVSTVSSNLNVSGLNGVITDLNIKLNINHTFDEDLTAYLISPKGERIQLFNMIGGSSNNFTNTILDDEAGSSIAGASAPFTGTFRPFVPLSNFDGTNPNGTWKLEITDWFAPDPGTLTSWSLTIATSEQTATTAAAGNYTFAGLIAGSYNVRQTPPAGFVQSSPASNGARSITTTAGTTSASQDFSDFPLNFATSGGDDTYVVSLLGSTNVQIVETDSAVPSTSTYTVPKITLASNALNFISGDGDDSLIIDYSGGNPLTLGGATWDAGANNSSPGDQFILLGTPLNSDTAVFGADSVTMNGTPITTTGVESVSFDGQRGLDNVTINSGIVTLPTTQQLQSLTINDGASAVLKQGGDRAIYTRSLTLGATAQLDLGDNDLLLDYTGSSPIGSLTGTTYDGVTGLVQSGRNGGTWDGAGIITSAFNGNYTTLAVAESADVNGTGTLVWAGETISDTTVIVKYTYGGDANLDGKLNIDDYVKIDNGISAALTGWINGDFNYDGTVNIDDYSSAIDANLPIVGPPL